MRAEQFAGRVGGRHAQRLQPRPKGGLAVEVGVGAEQMVLIDGRLAGAHGNPDQMPAFLDNVLAKVFLAPPEDHGGQQFP
jgi:hypothetical protein